VVSWSKIGDKTSSSVKNTLIKDSGDKRVPHELQPFLQTLNTLSVCTSECERGFSQMNLIASATRNCLSVHDHCFLSPICKTCWSTFCEVYASELHEVWLVQGRHSADDVNSLCSSAKDYDSAYAAAAVWDGLWLTFNPILECQCLCQNEFIQRNFTKSISNALGALVSRSSSMCAEKHRFLQSIHAVRQAVNSRRSDPPTEKARRPSVLRRYRGTIKRCRLADRRCRLATSVTGVQQLTTYLGALFSRHRRTMTAGLYTPRILER